MEQHRINLMQPPLCELGCPIAGIVMNYDRARWGVQRINMRAASEVPEAQCLYRDLECLAQCVGRQCTRALNKRLGDIERFHFLFHPCQGRLIEVRSKQDRYIDTYMNCAFRSRAFVGIVENRDGTAGQEAVRKNAAT